MTYTENREDDLWLMNAAMAERYGLSVYALAQWGRVEGYPHDAIRYEGGRKWWNVRRVEDWLRTRPLHNVGSIPRWAVTCEHPDLPTRARADREMRAHG